MYSRSVALARGLVAGGGVTQAAGLVPSRQGLVLLPKGLCLGVECLQAGVASPLLDRLLGPPRRLTARLATLGLGLGGAAGSLLAPVGGAPAALLRALLGLLALAGGPLLALGQVRVGLFRFALGLGTQAQRPLALLRRDPASLGVLAQDRISEDRGHDRPDRGVGAVQCQVRGRAGPAPVGGQQADGGVERQAGQPQVAPDRGSGNQAWVHRSSSGSTASALVSARLASWSSRMAS